MFLSFSMLLLPTRPKVKIDMKIRGDLASPEIDLWIERAEAIHQNLQKE